MKYYIARNGSAAGPFELNQLRCESVTPDTLVWHEGLDKWVKAADVPEVMDAISETPAMPPVFDSNYYKMQNSFRESPDNDMLQETRGYVHPPRPNNYLAEAIVALILCSPLIGIAAVVYASKVNKLYKQGLYSEALKASKNARNWTIAAIAFGIFINVIIYLNR